MGFYFTLSETTRRQSESRLNEIIEKQFNDKPCIDKGS